MEALKTSKGVASVDKLYHLAFDNSLQPNIISIVSSGKIIMANSAACRILGYSKKKLLTKNRSTIFDINGSSYKKMLKQRSAEGQSRAVVTAIKKSGKPITCKISSAVFMDENGIEKAIITLEDMSQSILNQKDIDTKKEKIVAGNIILAKSKQKNIDAEKEKMVADDIVLAKLKQKKIDAKKEKIVSGNIILALAKSDARQTENNKWKKQIGKSLYDVMWDWNITTDQIYVGDSIEEVFGYKVQNNTVNYADFSRCLLPEEKDVVEKKLLKTLASVNKSWNDSFKFKLHDGSVAVTASRASIIRDKEGKAIHLIGAIQDISKLKELEKRLDEQITIHEEDSEIFHLAAKLSFDIIWDWNILTNEGFIGEGFEELFGYPIKNNKGKSTDWVDHLHPDDKEAVEKELHDTIVSSATYWELAYRFIRADGSTAKVFNRASIIRDADGKAYRIIGAMQDISKQKNLEEKLDLELKLKEKQIGEAVEGARKTERSGIGRELHDNVNQLLGASRLYLNMSKKGGKDSEMFLNRSSEYTLTAIEEIRKLTKVLTTDVIKKFGLCESIDNVSRDLMLVSSVKISFIQKHFAENIVNDKFKLNVFRIVQEQLNNILKHAVATEVIIRLSQNKKSVVVSISDNGIGFDSIKKQNGMGIKNIKSRVAAYSGSVDFVSKSGKGCALIVKFPVIDALLNKK